MPAHPPKSSSKPPASPEEFALANQELEELVNRASAGDAEAFACLVERYRYAVYGIACAMLKNFEDAQDVAQEAFIKAWTGLPALRHASLFPAWLSQLTRNQCIDFSRRMRLQRRSEVHPIEEVENMAVPASNHPDKCAERNETRDMVHAAIASLSEPNRLAVMLFYMGEHTIDEIADLLKVPAGTIKRRLHDSRKQLKARMMHMVEDTIKNNRLPDDFTRRTVEKAIEEARALIGERKMVEAEEKLRGALEKIPSHAGALKTLNRVLMWGQVYDRSRWDLLREIAEHGRSIIASGEADETVLGQMANTLLAIPAMTEAASFLEKWIREKGANLERLGKLAWALGCLSQYDEAEARWQECMAMAQAAPIDEVSAHLGYACMTLVDCMTSAGEHKRAMRTARSGWKIWNDRKAVIPIGRHFDHISPFIWPDTFHMAGLEAERNETARMGFDALPPNQPDDLGAEMIRLAWRVRFDKPEAVVADFARILGANPGTPPHAYDVINAFFEMKMSGELLRLAGMIGNQEENAEGKNAEGKNAGGSGQMWPWWGQVNFPICRDLHGNCELDVVEKLLQESLAAGCAHNAGGEMYLLIAEIAIWLGIPTPEKLMQRIAEQGPDGADYFGWYHVAREAAAAGDTKKAFDALQRAVALWTNPPLVMLPIYESDARWGALRESEEFRRILEDARRRVGPFHGSLHYFPGW